MEWIGIKERFPDSNLPVLMHHKADGIVFGYRFVYLEECEDVDQIYPREYAWEYQFGKCDESWETEPSSCGDEDITHWMPLPDPPKTS
jgi:hypothetical protein